MAQVESLPPVNPYFRIIPILVQCLFVQFGDKQPPDLAWVPCLGTVGVVRQPSSQILPQRSRLVLLFLLLLSRLQFGFSCAFLLLEGRSDSLVDPGQFHVLLLFTA